MRSINQHASLFYLLALLALPTSATATDFAERLDVALSGAHRSAENRARDASRHPKETLLFFGLRPDMHVVELWPGQGWYTEVLAPLLTAPGRLTVASFGADNAVEFRARIHASLMKKLSEDPVQYGHIEVGVLDPGTVVDLGPEGSADMVLTFRNTHNWINDGVETEVYQAAFRALKPGGIFGVVQHRGEENWDPKVSAKNGYVPQVHVIAIAERAGFKLVDQAEINANPKDTKDHPEGVWTLPPSYRMGDVDRPRWSAIGESDRMTLKFVKPDID